MICTARAWLLAIHMVGCEREATHRDVGGCVHEHVRDTYVCPQHASLFREGAVCRCCVEGPETHYCRLTTLSVTPIGTEVVKVTNGSTKTQGA